MADRRTLIVLVLALLVVGIALYRFLAPGDSGIGAPPAPPGPPTSPPSIQEGGPDDPDRSSRPATAGSVGQERILQHLRRMTSIVEKTGYVATRYWPPKSYFFDPERIQSFERDLLETPGAVDAVIGHLRSLGRHHPAQGLARRLLGRLEGKIPGLKEKQKALDDAFAAQETAWDQTHGADRWKDDASPLYGILRNEGLPLGERLYLLTRATGGRREVARKDFDAMVGLLNEGAAVAPTIRARVAGIVGGTLASSQDPAVWTSAVASLQQAYAGSRAETAGVSFAVLEVLPSRSPRSLKVPADQREELDRRLAGIAVDELLQWERDDRALEESLHSFASGLTWKAAAAHYETARRLLLSGKDPALRKSALYVLTPGNLFSKSSGEAAPEETRRRAAETLMQAILSEGDAGLRDELATQLTSFMRFDARAVAFVESTAQWDRISPDTAEFLRVEIRRLRSGSDR